MESNSQSTPSTKDLTKRNRTRWGVFLALAITYFLVFSQRTAPGLISDQLMHEFQITAATLGMLAGIQYFAYMCLQVPLGLWADRVGPDRLLMLGALLEGVGTILYSLAPHESILMAARLLVGIGDSMIWINIVLVLGRWFRAEEFASILGWTGMSGSLGSLVTTVPLTYWIAAQGWRIPFFSLGTGLLGCVVLLYLALIRTKKQSAEQTKPTVSSKQRPSGLTVLKRLVRDRQAWATFLCHFGLVGTYVAFIGSWAVPYGMSVYGLNRASASGLVSLGLIGALAGGPIAGWLSHRMGGDKTLYVSIHVLCFLSWMSVIAMGGKPPLTMMMVLFILIGFCNGASTLTFAIVRKSFPLTETGVASGFANTGGFLSAVVLPPLFGFVLQHFGVSAASAPSQAVNVAYQFSFWVPALFSFFGILGGLAIREERKRVTASLKKSLH